MSSGIEFSATVLDESTHGEPTTATLVLGDDELRIEGETDSFAVSSSDIFDVKLGSSPRAAAEFFSGTVLTVGFDRNDRREVLFVDDDRSTLQKYAGLCYRWLLDGSEVAVRHPAEVGGRVTGESFDIGTLRVTPGQVGCTNITHPFGIDLDMIVHLSRFEGELLGDRRTLIDLGYVRDGQAVSLDLSVDPPRTQHLLGRHLRQEYDDVRQAVRTLDLPASAVRLLYRLYSRRGSADPSALFDGPSDASVELLRGLNRANLVRIDDGQVGLTSRGWILVTEHVDASAGGGTPTPLHD
jgi:hypothetical protein